MCKGINVALRVHLKRDNKVRDMMLKAIRPHISNLRGKFRPNWGGLYFVKRILSEGAAYIADLDEMEFASPVNIDKLKKYYP